MLLVLLLARLLRQSTHQAKTNPVFQHFLVLRLHFLDNRVDLTHVVFIARHKLRVAFVENRQVGFAGEEVLRERFDRRGDRGGGVFDRLGRLFLSEFELQRKVLRADLRVLRLLHLKMLEKEHKQIKKRERIDLLLVRRGEKTERSSSGLAPCLYLRVALLNSQLSPLAFRSLFVVLLQSSSLLFNSLLDLYVSRFPCLWN